MSNTRDEQAREPMPASKRPLWLFLGAMLLIMVVMGIVSAIIALLVR
jgi:quinol-cytochrome oxidoreductase complex cytochrome b subunit